MSKFKVGDIVVWSLPSTNSGVTIEVNNLLKKGVEYLVSYACRNGIRLVGVPMPPGIINAVWCDTMFEKPVKTGSLSMDFKEKEKHIEERKFLILKN